jgi:hypothetical protein
VSTDSSYTLSDNDVYGTFIGQLDTVGDQSYIVPTDSIHCFPKVIRPVLSVTKLSSNTRGSSTPQVGDTVRISNSDAYDDSFGFEYSWYRTDGSTAEVISGATGTSYNVTSQDMGKKLYVVVEQDGFGYRIQSADTQNVLAAGGSTGGTSSSSSSTSSSSSSTSSSAAKTQDYSATTFKEMGSSDGAVATADSKGVYHIKNQYGVTVVAKNTVVTATVEDEEGTRVATVITDENGKAIKNAVVKTNEGNTYAVGATGVAESSAIVAITIKDSKGKTQVTEYLTKESGIVAENEVVEVKNHFDSSGKKSEVKKAYLANKDGTIYKTRGFAEVENSSKIGMSDIDTSDIAVYVKKDGSLKKGERFGVTDSKGNKVYYAAAKNCEIITKGFFNKEKTGTTDRSIKKGDTFFAGEDGRLLTSTLFKVKVSKSGRVSVTIKRKGTQTGVSEDEVYFFESIHAAGLASSSGEEYYATKSGKVAKNKWVNVGLKEYYCGSNGAITKKR